VSAADDGDGDRADPNKPLSEADEMRFRALVKDAVRAANARRLLDAIKAYDAALDLQRDPLIQGRLGLILAMFDEPSYQVGAATNLYRAIAEHAGTSRAERQAFFDAFDLVQTRICRVDITTSDVNSYVQFDNHKPQKSDGAFWQFIEPGKHEIVATLKDHDDVRQTFDCPKGKRINVSLDFSHKDAPIKTVENVRERVVFVEAPSPSTNADKPSPAELPKKRRLNLSAGPAMVFGAAPVPAFGVSLAGSYTLGNVPVMLGIRSAYARGPIEGRKLDVFTFTGLAGPCLPSKWFNACGFVSVNVIKPRANVLVPDDFETKAQVVPGLGIGLFGRYAVKQSISLYASGDATILPQDATVYVLHDATPRPIWSGSQFLASVSMGIEFGR